MWGISCVLQVCAVRTEAGAGLLAAILEPQAKAFVPADSVTNAADAPPAAEALNRPRSAAKPRDSDHATVSAPPPVDGDTDSGDTLVRRGV